MKSKSGSKMPFEIQTWKDFISDHGSIGMINKSTCKTAACMNDS